MTARYPVWSGDEWIEVDVPVHGGSSIVVPNVTAIVHPPGDRSRLLLQRRDKKAEPVYGRLEIPGGRWHAGESAMEAVRREISEETGLTVVEAGPSVRYEPTPQRPFVLDRPFAVTAGVDGAYPAMLVAFVVEAAGTPTAQPGESFDVRFWQVGDVRELLVESPEAFTAGSFSVLAAYLEIA